jgi:hypothetical protein
MIKMNNKTLVIGASEKSSRYANRAIHALLEKQHDVTAVGKRKGHVSGVEIETKPPKDTDIHTVTLYINPILQKEYEDYLLQLKPERVIFNPGTENPELQKKLKAAGIEALEACTLILLAANQY